MRVQSGVAYTRFDVCDLVRKHTSRSLRHEDSFYIWLPFCLINDDDEQAFFSVRDVKKFLYISAYLYLKRDLHRAKAALALELESTGLCSHLYLDSVSIETFVAQNPIFARAKAHRERVAAHRKQSKGNCEREPKLRYAEVLTAV